MIAISAVEPAGGPAVQIVSQVSQKSKVPTAITDTVIGEDGIQDGSLAESIVIKPPPWAAEFRFRVTLTRSRPSEFGFRL